jgi:ubiquinone/menaquinone biosynthesis C-methylase UbiE
MQKRVLDIGFSTFGEESLPQRGTTIGLDIEVTPQNLQQTPKIAQIQGTAENLPFADNTLDRITAVNVPLENPEAIAAEILRVLKPGGSAFIRLGFNAEFLPEIRREIRESLKELGATNIRIRTIDIRSAGVPMKEFQFADLGISFKKP